MVLAAAVCAMAPVSARLEPLKVKAEEAPSAPELLNCIWVSDPAGVVLMLMFPEPRRDVEFIVFMLVPDTRVSCLALSAELRSV
jgi:hypothetical protein